MNNFYGHNWNASLQEAPEPGRERGEKAFQKLKDCRGDRSGGRGKPLDREGSKEGGVEGPHCVACMGTYTYCYGL